MRVVLDASSIIKSSFNLASPAFQTLLASAEQLHVELIIVDVVIAEVINHAAEGFDAKRQKANEAIEAYSKAAKHDVPTISDETQRVVVDQYRRRILRVLNEAGARIRPHAEVEHRVLVERDIAKRKPFGGSKSAYRDALIWFTVLDLLAEDGSALAFVTDNVNDFAASDAGEPALHEDLIADLQEHGNAVDSVVLLRGIEEFVERFVRPNLIEEEEIARLMKEGVFPGFSLLGEVERLLESFFGEVSAAVEPSALGFPDDVWSLWYHGDSGSLDLKEVTVTRVDTALLLIEVEASLSAELEVEFDARSDFAWAHDYGFDPDQMVGHTTVVTELSTKVQLTLNTDAEEVTSTAVLGLTVDDRDIEYEARSTDELLKVMKQPSWHTIRGH